MPKTNHPKTLYRNLTFFIWFLTIAILITYLFNRLHIISDMSFFFPDTLSNDEQVIQKSLNDGEANRIIFIQIYNNVSNKTVIDVSQLSKISKKIKQKLSKNDRFMSIENGENSNILSSEKQLYAYRYLISSEIDKTKNLFGTDSLKTHFNALTERLQMLASIDEQQSIAQDPLNIWYNYLRSLNNIQLNRKHGVWFNNQDQAIILLKTKASGLDLVQQKQNIKLIQSQLTPLMTENFSYHISGAALIAIDTSEKIAFQIQIVSFIASMILALFLFFMFRSFKLLILMSLPLFFAVIVGACVVTFFYGHIHGIALAFGITIIGVAVDYPIHYYSHLQESTEQSFDQKLNTLDSNLLTIISIWPKLKMGLLTTLIGFSAIIFSSFSGLNQLGLFAASGLIAAVLMTRYFLPLFQYKNSINFKTMEHWSSVFQFEVHCYYRYIIFTVLGIALIYILSHEQIWDNDLANMSPVSSQLKQQDFQLRKSLSLPELRYILLISEKNQQAVLERSEQLSFYLEQLIQKDIISHYDSVTNYLPSIKTQQNRQQSLPDKKLLLEQLNTAISETPFNIDAFEPFISSVDYNKHTVPLTPETLENSLIARKIKAILVHNKKTQQWNSLVLLSGVDNKKFNQAFSTLVYPNIKNIKLIDIKEQSHQLIKSYRKEAIQWFFIGCLFIIVFLIAYNQGIASIAALLIPFSGAIILTVTLLLALGYSLSIFHLVTLLLVVGLGIDYSIFIVDQENNEFSLKNQKSPQKTTINTFSVLVCAISSFIMFFSLSLSSIPVLKAIGLTASIGASMAFILTLLISRPCKT